jgi:hypothetical protein
VCIFALEAHTDGDAAGVRVEHNIVDLQRSHVTPASSREGGVSRRRGDSARAQ